MKHLSPIQCSFVAFCASSFLLNGASISAQTSNSSNSPLWVVGSAVDSSNRALEASSQQSSSLIDGQGESQEQAQRTDRSAQQDAQTSLESDVQSDEANLTKRDNTISNSLLREDIDAAFSRLQTALEEEDSFSELVGDRYFEYGHLLLRAGQYDDAREAFVDALHIEKINTGIYSLSQLPVLKAVFDSYFAQDQSEGYEEALERILWIENQNGGPKNDFAYELLLKVGNAYLDMYMRRPYSGENALNQLRSANQYLAFAIDRYESDHLLSEKPLPYGEIALINVMEGTMVQRMPRTVALHHSHNAKLAKLQEREDRFTYIGETYARGDVYLKQYLEKAKQEQNQSEVVTALLSLGDLGMFFERRPAAERYYQLAWNEAQQLPKRHELRESMNKPVALPAFKYALERDYVPQQRPTTMVPLSFSVNTTGRANKIEKLPEKVDEPKLYNRARRMVRKLTFRPAIVEGKVTAGKLENHEVRVKVDSNIRNEQLQEIKSR